jgi:glycosyltransferase involved in cell wall biosynthesis
MKPKISIIIPVYNSEEFLEECLNSSIHQTLQEIEIVIINDASTDKSLQIIKDFQVKDSRIKLIDFKKNKGNGHGRNEGIKKAKGEYILFLDSDDWLENNVAELTYKKAVKENYELIVFGYTQHISFLNNEKKSKELYLPQIADGSDDFYYYFMMHRKGMYSMPWIYLISRALLIEKKIEFSVGIYFEDIIFVAKALNSIQKIGVLNNAPLYNYRIRKNSITQSLSKKKIDDNFTAHVYFKKYLESAGIYKTYEKEYLIRFLVYCVFLSFWDYYRMSKKQKDRELDDYMKNIRKSKLLSIKNFHFLKTASKNLEKNEVRTKKTYKTAYFILAQIKFNLLLFRIAMKIIRFKIQRDERKQ